MVPSPCALTARAARTFLGLAQPSLSSATILKFSTIFERELCAASQQDRRVYGALECPLCAKSRHVRGRTTLHDRRCRAQVEHVALDLHHARLGLPQPVREERHKHGVRQGLFFLVCVERPAIGDVPKRLFLNLLVAATKPVAGREPGTTGVHELRRHIAVGCIHDDAVRLLSHGVKGRGAVNWLFDIGHQLPCADQSLAQSLCHERFSRFACRCVNYAEVCASLSMGSTWPEIDFPASEVRNRISAAMSLGSTKRFSDWMLIAAALSSSSVLCSALARP